MNHNTLKYTHMMEYYAAMKRVLLLYAVTWVKLKVIMLSERSLILKKCRLHDSIYVKL